MPFIILVEGNIGIFFLHQVVVERSRHRAGGREEAEEGAGRVDMTGY